MQLTYCNWFDENSLEATLLLDLHQSSLHWRMTNVILLKAYKQAWQTSQAQKSHGRQTTKNDKHLPQLQQLKSWTGTFAHQGMYTRYDSLQQYITVGRLVV